MQDSGKPPGMGRRSFLQLTGGGLLLSMVAPRIVSGAETGDVALAGEGFTLTLGFPPGAVAQIRSLRNTKTNFEWARRGTNLEPVFTTNQGQSQGWTSSPGARSHPLIGDHFEFASHTEQGGLSTRVALQAFSDFPILEFQAEFHNASKSPLEGVTGFGPFRFALRDDLGPLQVHAVRRNEYALESIPVKAPVLLSGGHWNAPEYCGLLILEAVDAGEFLLIGVEWERGWCYRIEQDSNKTWLSVYVADLAHDMAPGERLPVPRIFLGLSHGSPEQVFLDTQRYMRKHVFPVPLKDSPWIVYDFWATEAEGVEEALLREVDFATKLGVETFNMDASWYLGSSKKGTGDWGCGLGHYTDDRQKYPSGLASISHRVHESGMKFGLWVGPNVADSRIIGTVIPKQWVAQVDGKDQILAAPTGWESSVHQVCLGCREYIDFLKKELTRIVRDFHLDWLKWDNSGIPASPARCNRKDHGHQAGDGSYAALVGQYEIFDYLHATFPNLVLEQCGYGSRLDYGLARTIRSNWLSDASYPSQRVRDNAMVSSRVYPSAYNGAWIVSEDVDLQKNADDPAMLDTIFRSRMISLFGFGTINGQLKERVSLYPEPVILAARRNIACYKGYRHLLQYDCYRLTPGDAAPSHWQAIQFVSPSGQEAVVLVFRGESSQGAVRLSLQGLRTAGMYELNFSSGSGPSTKMKGEELLSKGMAVSLPTPHSSEVVSLRML
ncbi:MAG: alpha-galactosidase [Acidobacteriaceae bacterium]